VGEDPPALDAGIAGLVLGPDFSDHYRVFDLGPVPGLSDKRLGGCVIKRDDFNTLLIAGDSEAEEGAIYAVPVKRNNCGHIVGFNGSASIVVQAPYIDANLLYEANGVLIFTQWNSNQISQLAPDSVSIGVTTDMATLGVPVSVSGLAFVPPSLPAAGALRTVTFPSGDWFHLATHAAGPFCSIDSATETTQLPNGPGGLAYVPQGSPGFPNQSLIAAEWSTDTVGVYEVDEQGDPLVATRRDFFSWFEKPWGAYYDPQTGDYLFLSWGTDVDRVIIVQGFAVPPPAPPPPPTGDAGGLGDAVAPSSEDASPDGNQPNATALTGDAGGLGDAVAPSSNDGTCKPSSVPCGAGDTCCNGLDCADGICGGCHPADTQCATDSQCCTKSCFLEKCACFRLRDTCVTQADCCDKNTSCLMSGSSISGRGSCCLGINAGCASNTDCCSGACDNGECDCGGVNQFCDVDDQCCSGTCCAGKCMQCSLAGESCKLDCECCSNKCTSGQCESTFDCTCTDTVYCKNDRCVTGCNVTLGCFSGNICGTGTTRRRCERPGLPSGSDCTTNKECYSGRCQSSVGTCR